MSSWLCLQLLSAFPCPGDLSHVWEEEREACQSVLGGVLVLQKMEVVPHFRYPDGCGGKRWGLEGNKPIRFQNRFTP